VTGGPAAQRQLWLRCGSCAALLYRKRLRRNLDVCPECGDHRRLDAPERIRQLVDPDTFEALPEEAVRVDPLGFVDSVPYPQRLAHARIDTGLPEAVLCGQARIGGHPLVLAVMDFRFLGGSLGCAVGELVTRAAERALAAGSPLLVVTASGGARMQEGALALMQMATVSQAIGVLREAGLLTVSLVTDPTYGGVAASFATNTDVVIVESGSRMGFAGPRVIRQTIRQSLPEGFQTSEFLLRHGQVDLVAGRRELRGRLRSLLAAARWARTARRPAVPAARTPDAGPPPPAGGPGPAEAAGHAWWTVRAARHPDRPTTLDYLSTAFDDFVELHGDRWGADCPAVVAGLARLDQWYVAVVGHQKGHDLAQLRTRNFGMASPAGHRKAVRVMRLAARLGLPVVTLIDTPGADPGVEAERGGQAGAIAETILTLTGLPTPVLAVVTGEGGSGGALALAVADRVLMLQNAVYSVISPEGCAAILWKDRDAAPTAARALRLTAADLLRLGVVDAVVAEPDGGAQADPDGAADLLRRALTEHLGPLLRLPARSLVRQRRQRFRRYGAAGAHPRAAAR
jgi:acetyl-CoA carboxylase carboxyl transferase subunit beta